MKSSWDNIKNISKKFGDDLDVDASWKRFEEKRNKKKKRYFTWWLFGLFTLLLFIFLPVWASFKKNSENKPQATSQNVIIKKGDLNKKIINHDDNIEEQTQRDILNQDKKNIGSHQEIEANLQTPNNSVKNTKSTQSIFNKESNSIKVTEYIKDVKIINRSEENDHSIFTNENSNSAISDKLDPSEKKHQENIERNKIQQLEFLNSKIKRDLLVFNRSLVPKPELVLLKKESSDKNNRPYLTIQTAFGLVDRKLSNTNNQTLMRRQNNEEFKEHMAINAIGKKFLSDNIFVSLGLGVQQVRSSIFEVSQVIENNVSFDDVVVANLYSQGNTTQIKGTVVGSKTFVTEHTRYQRYIDINLTTSIGYQLNLSDKIFVNTSTGIGTSIVNSNKGMTFKSNNSSGEYSNLDELGYKNNFVFKSISELNIGFNLNDKSTFQFGIGYNMDLSNRLDITDQSDQFRNAFLSTGVSFKL